MVNEYMLADGRWTPAPAGRGHWIRAVNPTEDELVALASTYKVEIEDLRSGLDDLELPRYEDNDGYIMLYMAASRMVEDASWRAATLGIAVLPEVTITVSRHETELVEGFKDARFKCTGECAGKDVALQLLLKSTQLFIRDLHIIDQKNAELEKKLGIAMKNSLIFGMLSLQKSLVYLRTAVNGNQSMLEKLNTVEWLVNDPKRKELLDDIRIENKQACDMAAIYTDIMGNTVDAFASVINNNLNVVMKLLTGLTLIMAIPVIVMSAFGMNVPMQWVQSPSAFVWIVLFASGLTGLAAYFMAKKRLF